jgi:predicted MFS family arabinose efflux permease
MRLWPKGGLWRRADFLRLWGAHTISQFGTQITLLAMPLAAIVSLDATPFEVALLGALEYAPFLLLTLPAGVWVDRVRRRPLLIAADVGRALVLVTVPLAWAFDVLTIWQLLAVGFAMGTFTVVFDVAYVPYIATLVERHSLVDANSKMEITRSAAQAAGPGLGGALVQLFGAPFALAADAVSFVVSGLLAWRIRTPEEQPETEPAGRSTRRELGEGLRYVVHHPLFRPIMATTAASNFFGAAVWGPLLLLYGVRVLELDPARIGLVLAIGNVGVIAGAFAVRPITELLGIGRTIAAASILFGPVVLLIPLAPKSQPEPLLIAGLAITGFGGVVFNVAIRSLVQAITPNRLLGRTTAVVRMIVWGVIPVGTLLGGVIASTVGISAAIWAGAIGASLAALPVLLSQVPSVTSVEPAPEAS